MKSSASVPKSFALGIFAKTFSRPNVAGIFSAIATHELRTVQFNFSCCGLPTLPEQIAPEILAELQKEQHRCQLQFAAVSATFNLIHPDENVRRHGLERLPILAAAACSLGCPLLTLCTGTLDPEDMWRAHRDNASPQAWRELRLGIDTALESTASSGVHLGIEPETGNVIDSAKRCRRLLDEVGSPRLKVVLDPANLLDPGDPGRQRELLDEAFDLLGDSLALAHAKELAPDWMPDGRGPGRGILDWGYYLDRLWRTGFTGSLILHGLREAEVGAALRFLSVLIQNSDRDRDSPEKGPLQATL